MKKTTVFSTILAMAFVLTIPLWAYADACFWIIRDGDPELPNNQVNALQRDCTRDNNCWDWYDYDGRTRQYDIIDVTDASRCPEPASQNPGSTYIQVVVTGIDFDAAHRLTQAWNELDPNSGEYYMKRQRKYGMIRDHLSAGVQSLLDDNSWLTFDWQDLCGYINNKLTDLDGTDCL